MPTRRAVPLKGADCLVIRMSEGPKATKEVTPAVVTALALTVLVTCAGNSPAAGCDLL